MATYWAATAQLLAVLVLAFVVEMRALSHYWRDLADWTNPIVGALTVVCIGCAGWVIVASVRTSLPGADPRYELVPVAEFAVSLMILGLVVPAGFTILVRSFAGPLARALVLSSPAFRHVRRETRRARRSLRAARAVNLKTERVIQGMLPKWEYARTLAAMAPTVLTDAISPEERAEVESWLARHAEIEVLIRGSQNALARAKARLAKAERLESELRTRLRADDARQHEWLRRALAGFPDPPGDNPWKKPRAKRKAHPKALTSSRTRRPKRSMPRRRP